MDGPSGESAEKDPGGAASSTDDPFSSWAEDEATLGPDELLGDEEPEDEAGEERVETIDEEGRRRVRLAAPEGTEELLEREMPRRTGLPDWAERWRTRSAAGTVLTAVAFGLQQVFEPERKEPAIVMETSGDPPTDLPVEAELEQLGPRQSTVKVRPWLLAAPDAEAPERKAEGGAHGEEPGEQ